MDKNKQTAVEWLEEQRKWSVITNEHFDQAKAIEKQQIIDANNIGYSAGKRDTDETAEQYYTSTYGQ
jgi:hypothetical protein